MTNLSLRIALLDDKQFGIHQIKAALPPTIAAEVIWFADLPTFHRSAEVFDILLLDFYLDNDGISSDAIFDDVRPKAKTIIAFSSSASGNEKLLACGAEFAITKTWDDKNEKLENLFLEIIERSVNQD